MRKRYRDAALRLRHGGGQQEREERAGHEQRAPLRRQHTRPVRISEENQEPVISAPGQSESQQRGTDAVKHPPGCVQGYSHKRQTEEGGGQGIELLRVRVGILAREKVLSTLNGPAEVTSALVKMSQEETAVSSGDESDRCRYQDSQSHGEFGSHKL